MIRKAATNDIPGLLRLLHQVNDVHAEGRPDIFVKGNVKYTYDELTSLLKDESRPVFVYGNPDGDISGYCFCMIEDYPEGGHLYPHKTLYIDDLCVDSGARGGGIGTKLYNYVKDFAKKERCHNLTLNVWQENPTALRFYQSQGLKVMKTTLETLL